MSEEHEPRITVRIDEDLSDLIPGYLENRRKDIDAIRAALDQGDFETIRVLGHGMKGSGGGYGFDAITEIGRSLEQAAKSADADGIKQQVDELASYLDRLDIVFG